MAGLIHEVHTAIGLMSGTSADGVDAAMVRTDGEYKYEFVDGLSVPYETDFRERLLACARGETSESTLLTVEQELTAMHAAAVVKLAGRNQSDNAAADLANAGLIGFHGHTISHNPSSGQTRQIGNGRQLAEAVEIPVVYDFRSEDMRAGGQGAPLVPLFHAMLFADAPKPAVVLNIGGVANITWLDGDTIVAGDTGPGCGLLDAWIQSQTGLPYDKDGKLANQGTVDFESLEQLSRLPFFNQPLPKSADRFDFDAISVEHLSPADGAATLCAVTATSIADAIDGLGTPITTWVTGGGSKHPLIMRQLSGRLGDVQPIEAYGLRSDSLEAECFAWLAVRRLRGLPTTLPSTTGCAVPTCGGKIAEFDG